MQVRFLGLENPLEEVMATHPSILVWRIPWTEESGYSPWGCKDLDTAEATYVCVCVLEIKNKKGGRKRTSIK